MEQRMMPEREMNAAAQAGPGSERGEGARAARAGTVMEVPPEVFSGLGLASPPAMGEEFELRGRAACRGQSRRGGAVLQIEVTGLDPLGHRADGPEGLREREAFFRTLFEGEG